MLPAEATVWQRWLDLAQLTDDVDISYDITVGEGIRLSEDFPDPYRTNAEFLSKKRIDAVITFADLIVIVEVKKIVSWAAIGQLIGYPVLFAETYMPTIPITTLLVAESFPLDVQRIFDATGLPYDLVPVGATAIISRPEQKPQPEIPA